MTEANDKLLRLVLERAVDVFWRSDLMWPRIAVAVASLLWAFILLVLGYQFDRPSYYWMQRAAPQWAWGVGFAAVGILQLARAFVGAAVGGRGAAIVAGVIFWMWAGASIAIVSSQSPPPGMSAGTLAITLLAFVILVRSVIDSRWWRRDD